MGLADLHLHTTASDGKLSPEELVARAGAIGMQYIAITDHDSTEGVDGALEAAKAYPGLIVIPGIEMSTDIPHAEVHILGYLLDYHDAELQEHLLALRDGRVDRAKKMVSKLADLGMTIEWKRVKELAGAGSVGRPHIAQAMLELGYIPTFRQAFDLYIGREGPAYAERFKLTPEEAVALIARKGGLPVLAHPAEHPSIVSLLPSLVEAGLVGMEIYYGGYSGEVIDNLLGLAGQYGLIPTGGSDFHGFGTEAECQIGNISLPLEPVRQMIDMSSWKAVPRPSATLP